ILFCAILLVFVTLVEAQERRPGRLFPSEKIDILEEPREWQKGEEVMRLLGIKEGDVVADIGAGSGYFAFLMAERVGEEGLVYAEDIQQGMIDFMADKIERSGAQNIKLILGEPEDPKLPENSLDLAIMGNVYHEVENPVTLMKDIYKELKPNGRLVIIDWSPMKPSPIGPPIEVRVHEHDLTREAEEAGFYMIRRYRSWPYHYFVVFKKKKWFPW
ncbi:MAG: class I SAM-dependent methyltransferase, partial [Candidatus Brocadiales bacterium]